MRSGSFRWSQEWAGPESNRRPSAFRRNNRPGCRVSAEVDGCERVPVAVDSRHRCRQTRRGAERVAQVVGVTSTALLGLVMLSRMTFNASASSGPAGPPERAWSYSKLAALLGIRLERRLARLGFWMGVPISVAGGAVWALCARLN